MNKLNKKNNATLNKVRNFLTLKMGYFRGIYSALVAGLSMTLIIFFSSTAYSQFVKWEETFATIDIESRGWLRVNYDSSSSIPEFRSAFTFLDLGYQNAYNGNTFYLFNFDNANAVNKIDDWLITPQLSNIKTGDTIAFWCGSIDLNFKDSIRVFISTTNNNIGSFNEIDKFKVDGSAGVWHKKSYDLSAYNGMNIYFAVNYYHNNGGALGTSSDHVWIDYFKLTGKEGTAEVTSYELAQNFPNPFNPGTEITFSLPEASNVSLKIYDITGKEVAVLINEFRAKGKYNISFDGSNFASGVYFYNLVTPKFTDTKKMVLKK